MAAKQTVKTTTVKRKGLAALKTRKTRSDKGKKRGKYKRHR